METLATLDLARGLLDRGLRPIPVPQGQKAPRIPGWQNLRVTADSLPTCFNDTPSNIGVLLGEPSGWIVDVDLDHARAVELADEYLPTTGMVWGRAGKPRSHRLYRVAEPVPTRKWLSKSAGMIVELRSTGCQTIAPGSTHPSGEVVRFDADGEPARVAPDQLVTAINALAVAVRRELGEDVPTEYPGAPLPEVNRGSSRYALAALHGEARRVAATPEGARNDTLNAAAFNVGTLIGAGELDRAQAEAELVSAARACRLPAVEARRTIASALNAGVQQPRQRRGADRTPGGGPKHGDMSASALMMRQKFVPFPLATLPHALSQFIRETADALGCDPAYVALPALCANAAAIGTSRAIELKESWREYAILWMGLVARSGTLKSPAFDAALRPLRDAQRDALRDHAEKLAEYESANEEYQTELAVWRKKPNGGRPPERPKKPEPPLRYLVSDVTVEGLAPILEENPRGLLLARDELCGWIRGFDQYKAKGRGGDVPQWLEMWRGGQLLVDRKTGDKRTIHVECAAVSVSGTIQPGVLAAVLTDEYFENGLAARLLLAQPPERKKRWSELAPSPSTLRGYEELVLNLLALEHVKGERGPEPVCLRLSAEAHRLWRSWYDRHAQRIYQADSDRDAAALAKAEAYAARFGLVITLVADPAATEVSADAMRHGTVLADWFAAEGARVHGLVGEGAEVQEVRWLVGLIERLGGRCTVRDLMRKSRRFPTAVAAENALNELVNAGLGRWEVCRPGPAGGHPNKHFLLAETNSMPADAPAVDTIPVLAPASSGSANVSTVGGPDDADHSPPGDGGVLVSVSGEYGAAPGPVGEDEGVI